jgi:hypothetical protein
MGEIVIAIRTANRINTIEEHTLKVIKDLPYKVYIFCPENEKRDYLKKYKGKYTITNGGDEGPHLCNQKIVDYFTINKKIVQMDDDIKEFLEWNGEKFINGNLQHYIEEGFRLCERENYKLFGFYPDKDLQDVSKGLQLCKGGIHGFINDKSLRTIDNYSDDYERCILNYLKYGGCITFNKCKIDTIYKSTTIDNMKASTEYMVNKYPDYCSVNTYPELQIKNRQYCIKHHLQRQLNLITWEKNCDRPNVSGLDEEKTKNRQNRVGFPCYSYTFGYIRPRRAVKGTLQLTKITEKYPLIYRLAKDLCKSLEPEHQFTTITINKDIVCQPHIDKYNNGNSLIISIGDYTEGGNLYIKEKDGTIKKYDTRTPLYFNGAKHLHWNDRPNSQRFSFVYYKSN